MTFLDNLAKANIPITWRLIYMALNGTESIPPITEPYVVVNYATNLLAQNPDSASDEVVQLASEINPTRESLNPILQNLIPTENTNDVDEQQKLRWWLIRRTLEQLPSDPLEGLLELSDIWLRTGYEFTAEFAHELTHVDNQTPSRYKELQQKHRHWLHDEARRLSLPLQKKNDSGGFC